jgi:hypothetical protein
MSKKEYINRYKDSFFDCLDECYSKLYGTVPISEEMRKDLIDQFMLILNKKFLYLIVDETDRVCAFGLCFPGIGSALKKSGGRLTPASLIKLLKAVKAIRSRGAAILWLYAPGYSNANSTADMEKLTGIRFAKCDSSGVAAADMKSPRRVMGMAQSKVESRFYPLDPDEVLGTYADGKPAVARIRTGKSDAYFSAVWQLDMEFIKELMRRAGVHLYSDSLDPMEANERFFTLHARRAGKKTVCLRKKVDVVDVFNRRLVAKDVDEFSFDAPLHSSWLFYCAEDAGELLGKLK